MTGSHRPIRSRAQDPEATVATFFSPRRRPRARASERYVAQELPAVRDRCGALNPLRIMGNVDDESSQC